MARGMPCIASAIGPIEEVAGGAALLVPPGDVPALAGIDRLCADAELRQHLSDLGRERAARFSVERMGAAALGLYQELIEGYGG